MSPSEYEGIPDTPEARSCLRAAGHNASAYASSHLSGEVTTLRFDRSSDRRGSFGRLLGHVDLNASMSVNYALLTTGQARVYESVFTQEVRYEDAEGDARDRGVGVWRCQGEEAPEGGTQLRIATIHADADGNDNENLNDEYIVFENTGDTTLELGYWTVSDAAGHTYQFPQGFELARDEMVTLYTGSGENTETALYWGQERAVWNNSGDTIRVTNDVGVVVLEAVYQ